MSPPQSSRGGLLRGVSPTVLSAGCVPDGSLPDGSPGCVPDGSPSPTVLRVAAGCVPDGSRVAAGCVPDGSRPRRFSASNALAPLAPKLVWGSRGGGEGATRAPLPEASIPQILPPTAPDERGVSPTAPDERGVSPTACPRRHPRRHASFPGDPSNALAPLSPKLVWGRGAGVRGRPERRCLRHQIPHLLSRDGSR